MKLKFIFIWSAPSCIFLLLLLLGYSMFAFPQDIPPLPKTTEAPSIQDNSFLIEEAYNQEDGVVQHITSFQRLTTSRDWVYTLTDEWPLRSIKHQLSLTLAGTHA